MMTHPSKTVGLLLAYFLLFFTACGPADKVLRTTEDFNFDWQFHLGEVPDINATDLDWEDVRLPHDWSMELGYQQEETAASTGFVPGGIGYYKKALPWIKPSKSKRFGSNLTVFSVIQQSGLMTNDWAFDSSKKPLANLGHSPP